MIDIELDMTVEPIPEIDMSVDDGDEVEFGVDEAVVIKDHAILDNRDLPDQHPISAITGLAEALAESGKIDTVKVNGTALPVVNKAVDVPVPVQSVNGQTGDVVVNELPSATEDGTALVYVDGEWTKQTGYGYKNIEDTDLLWAYFNVSSPYNPAFTSESVDLVVGEEYTVTYDGRTPYTLTAFSGTVSPYGEIVALGNGSYLGLSGGDNTCPILYAYSRDASAAAVITPDTGGHYILIHGAGTVFHTIDNKYIKVPIEDVSGVKQEYWDNIYEGSNGSTRINSINNDGASSGYRSIAINFTLASGEFAVSSGYDVAAAGDYSFAHGATTAASGDYSVAFGNMVTAQGDYSTAFGHYSSADGEKSFAAGNSTAMGECSAALGSGYAAGDYSFATGDTEAFGDYQHTFGKNNIPDNYNTYVEIVGNGADSSHRANARTLDWNGNEVLAGKLTVGTAPTNAMDVATKQYVDNSVVTPPVTSVNGRTGAVTGLAEASDLDNYLDKRTGGNVKGNITAGGYIYLTPVTSSPTNSNQLIFNSVVNNVGGVWNVTKVNDDLRFTTATSGSYINITFKNDGSIQAKTQATTDNSTKVATTAFVKSVLPTVPTNVSAFTNDAGYLVASDFVEVTDADVIAIVV